MCYDDHARPPAPVSGIATTVESLTMRSLDGARFAAVCARPADPRAASGVGVLLLPDNLGLRPFYRELAVRFAELGHTVVCVDYYGRTAGVTGERTTNFPVFEHLASLSRNTLFADFATGIAELRARGCRSIVSVGFCMGGRFAFLTADPSFGLSGAIGCYGAPDELRGAPGPIQRASELTAPILGLFGGADEGIPPQTVRRFGDALTAAGVPHELVTYPGAPHGFFDQDLAADHPDACADTWRRFVAFLGERGAAL